MNSVHVPARVSRAGRWSVVIAVAASAIACSSTDAGPDVIDATPNATVSASEITVSPLQTWGQGRALRTFSAMDGSLAVVTTTGVFRLTTDDSTASQIDQFEPGIQIGPAALSADGQTLVVSTVSPPTVRAYDLGSATKVAAYDLPLDIVIRGVWSDELTGRVVVDTTGGPFVSHEDSVTLGAASEAETAGLTARLSDGALVTPVSSSNDLTVSRDTTSERRTLPLPGGYSVIDARSSPNGMVLAVTIGSGDDVFERQDQIVVLDPTTFEQRGVIDIGRALDSDQWSITDSTVIVTDGLELETWAFDGQPAGSLTPGESSITGLHPASDLLLTEHADGALVRWAGSPMAPTVIMPGAFRIEHVAVDPVTGTATVTDQFGMITTWRLSDGAQITSDAHFNAGEATAVAMAADGESVAVVSSAGTVSVLDTSLSETWAFRAADSPVRIDAVSFDPATGVLATGLAERRSETAFDDTVSVWDPARRTERFRVGGEGEDVAGCSFFYGRLRFSHDGTKMAVTSHDFSVFLLDASTGAVLHEFPGTTTVLDVAFNLDDSLLVATYDNSDVKTWATDDYAEAASYRGAQGGYFAIEMVPNTATMAVSDITGLISVVDVVTGTPIITFATADFRASTLAVSNDGSLLAAPVANGGVGIWSTATGQRVATASGHTATVTGIEFSPAGDWLVSSSSDGTVRTWSLGLAAG